MVLDQNVISNQQLHDNRDVLDVDFNFPSDTASLTLQKKYLNFLVINRSILSLETDYIKDFVTVLKILTQIR